MLNEKEYRSRISWSLRKQVELAEDDAVDVDADVDGGPTATIFSGSIQADERKWVLTVDIARSSKLDSTLSPNGHHEW